MKTHQMIAGIALLSLSMCVGASDEDVLREFKTVLWPQAYRTQDVELLDRMLHDSFVVITDTGEISTKKGELEYITNNKWDPGEFEYRIERLDIYDSKLAIISGRGIAEDYSYRSSNVLIREEGRWQAISSHVSGVKQNAPPESADDNGIEHALVHPPFSESYSCSEHWDGQLPYPGDALGADCTIGKLVEDSGRLWMRDHTGSGHENEDWFGYGADVLAPCDCTIARIRINPDENVPGVLGQPPASSITFERPDGTLVLLAHVKDIRVSQGDAVNAGDIVASVGNNGYSRQPHVHIGAWRGEVALQIRFDQKRITAPGGEKSVRQ